jgi:hypothetical protein
MPALVAARDISIIVLALSSIIVWILLAVLIFQTIRLTRTLRDEILPMLQAMQETLGTVRGTATFMGDHVVQPVVKASSYAHGVKSALRVLFGG